MHQGIRPTLLLALAALLAGCPGSLPGGDLGAAAADISPGSLGGPCFSDNTCYSGLACSSGVCIQSSSSEWGTSSADGDGPRAETSTPTPDQAPPTPDQTPPKPDQKIVTKGGFGSGCTAAAGCSASLVCVLFGTGATKGYCTKTCSAMRKPCSGGASGEAPYCLFKDSSGKYYCVFICKWGTGSSVQTASCPKDLTCSTSQNPPKSGQYICMP